MKESFCIFLIVEWMEGCMRKEGVFNLMVGVSETSPFSLLHAHSQDWVKMILLTVWCIVDFRCGCGYDPSLYGLLLGGKERCEDRKYSLWGSMHGNGYGNRMECGTFEGVLGFSEIKRWIEMGWEWNVAYSSGYRFSFLFGWTNVTLRVIVRECVLWFLDRMLNGRSQRSCTTHSALNFWMGRLGRNHNSRTIPLPAVAGNLNSLVGSVSGSKFRSRSSSFG